MKKILLVLVCILSLFTLASCGKKAGYGEYKFSSMSTKINFVEVNITAGEEISLLGVTLDENYMTLTISEDGKYTLTLNGTQLGNLDVVEQGFWKYADGVYTLTSSTGNVTKASYKSNTLTFEYSTSALEASVVLEKK